MKAAGLSPGAYLSRVIRVDQAGELGADYIYRGQISILSNTHPHLRPVLKHMWEQEQQHRKTFDRLQVARRVRPSLLTPVWKVGAMALGAGTAWMGPEAAMACTEAVETVIGGHYNGQLREMKQIAPEVSLMRTISQFRDDELEHLGTALEHGARRARPYFLLTEAIKTVCRCAIHTAERI